MLLHFKRFKTCFSININVKYLYYNEQPISLGHNENEKKYKIGTINNR